MPPVCFTCPLIQHRTGKTAPSDYCISDNPMVAFLFVLSVLSLGSAIVFLLLYLKVIQENKRFEPCQAIIDAEGHAANIRRNAESEAISIRQQAQEQYDKLQRYRTEIQEYGTRRKAQADKEFEAITGRINFATMQYRERMDQTEREVAIIISRAENQAKAQADVIISAAKAESKKKRESLTLWVDKLTKTADALRNKIDGYGLEYMMPGIGLLDDLAIDYGHTKAGQTLKTMRANVRKMVRAGKTAHCKNFRGSEEQQNTSIAFVTNVFNGMVEEVLSRVRSDNYGILAQEIRDAAILVNRGTTTLANTEIEIDSVYIESRLVELKWATIVHELKVKEREEQKAIREQMREEEKVRKEIEKARKEAEKAQRDAEKEIEREQKIYDELRAKFATMSEKERTEAEAKHTQELAEIQERLRLAEEKGQRALSMAQQTKQGYVYIISNIGSFGENVYKIGMTRRLEPKERVHGLSGASVPFPFDIHGMIQFQDCPAAEKQLHRLFVMSQVNKTNFRKEFFRVSLSDIKAAIEKLGGEAHWTMLAEAAEYRETLHIEERIADDASYRQQWEERQMSLCELSTPTWDDEE